MKISFSETESSHIISYLTNLYTFALKLINYFRRWYFWQNKCNAGLAHGVIINIINKFYTLERVIYHCYFIMKTNLIIIINPKY